MKGNDGTGNNVDRDEWETPQWLFYVLDDQYNFSFDCCSNKYNTKCFYFSEDFKNISDIKKLKMAWMNPPFSKAKEMFETFFQRC